MRKLLKKIIPHSFVLFVRACFRYPAIFGYYPRDIRRYLKYSATLVDKKEFGNLEAKVIADGHIIEKGLSLKNPRLGFGKGVILRLVDELKNYKKRKYPEKTFAQKFAISVLHRYLEYNTANGYDISDLEPLIKQFSNKGFEDFSGTHSYNKKEVLENVKKNFESLIHNRFSLRQFTDEPVSREILEKVIDLARFTPSVCNRQSTKVYIVEEPKIKQRVVDIQQGNRGFGEQIDKMLVVTSDIHFFFGLQERYQSFVDGGLFAMNLLLSLAYYGIGACGLNWCAETKRDNELRKLLKIKESENIIMMIAIGNMPDEFKTAKSHKREISDIAVWI